MILPLFCFGSLMDPDMLTCVLNRYSLPTEIRVEQASIANYRKVQLPHETYPVLVPQAEGLAPGVLIHGLNKEDLERIVFFEGEEYELAPCRVLTERDVQWVKALFFDEGVMPQPRSEEWDYVKWQKDHKDHMIRQTMVYMSCYGKMSAVEADHFWQEYRD